MSEEDTKEMKGPGRKPDMVAYTVRTVEGKSYWNRIGAAWRHRDGLGVEIDLDSLPKDGRVTLREMRDERLPVYEAERAQSSNEPALLPAPTHGPSR